MSDVPAYLVDTLRGLAGADNVTNATALLIDAQDGLRVINEPEQIAYLEWASCHVSDGVKRLLSELQPGMTEHEAVALLALERHAAVVPLDADRWAAREIRPAFTLRQNDRARRHVHHGLRHLGRADVSRRLPRRGRERAAASRSATTSTAWSRPISRQSRSGSRRSASARPAAR